MSASLPYNNISYSMNSFPFRIKSIQNNTRYYFCVFQISFLGAVLCFLVFGPVWFIYVLCLRLAIDRLISLYFFHSIKNITCRFMLDNYMYVLKKKFFSIFFSHFHSSSVFLSVCLFRQYKEHEPRIGCWTCPNCYISTSTELLYCFHQFM